MTKSKISSIDLILLGIIRNKPMSAYDLSKLQGIYELVKISIPAIYKNMRRLEREKLLAFSRQKTGKMPEKKIYSLTPEGERRFQELLESCATSAFNLHFDFNVPLLFINSIDPEKRKKIIKSIQDRLQVKHEQLTRKVEDYRYLPFPIGYLGMQHVELTRGLLDWLQNFEAEMKKGK